MARMLPREAELVSEESVKLFERSNGLDTALYKTRPVPLRCSPIELTRLCIVFQHMCAFLLLDLRQSYDE